jgi:type IV secretory pathway VirB2 component (pilin)
MCPPQQVFTRPWPVFWLVSHSLPLILLLTPRLSSQPVTDTFGDAIRILITAFLALVLTSLNYAVLGGEQQSSYRATVEESVAGVGFSIAGLLVIYAIVLTLDAVASGQPPSAAIAEVVSFLRGVLASFIAPLLVLYLYIAALRHEAWIGVLLTAM